VAQVHRTAGLAITVEHCCQEARSEGLPNIRYHRRNEVLANAFIPGNKAVNFAMPRLETLGVGLWGQTY